MRPQSAYYFAQRSISGYLSQLAILGEKISKKKHVCALHDVRVACRRLRTSLWIFQELFPHQQCRQWRSSLKRFASTLGEARDLDTQIAFLKKMSRNDAALQYRDVLSSYRKALLHKRSQLQGCVCEAYAELISADTVERMVCALKFLEQKKSRIDLVDLSRRRISKRLETMLDYRHSLSDPGDVKALHGMRIAAKHLRYTLETFVSIDQNFSLYVRHARALQRVLGVLHDFDVWLEGIRSKKYRSSNALDQATADFLKLYYKKSRSDLYHRFTRIWQRQQRKAIWKDLAKLLR